jgi:hypothetical protein
MVLLTLEGLPFLERQSNNIGFALLKYTFGFMILHFDSDEEHRQKNKYHWKGMLEMII